MDKFKNHFWSNKKDFCRFKKSQILNLGFSRRQHGQTVITFGTFSLFGMMAEIIIDFRVAERQYDQICRNFITLATKVKSWVVYLILNSLWLIFMLLGKSSLS